MTEADAILEEARGRGDRKAAAHAPTDYVALNKMVKRQRAALTRAVNAKDRDKVILACRDAVREWSGPGVHWPDDWPRWQRALDDVLPWGQQVQLEDLR
jgi:hypothetical protein